MKEQEFVERLEVLKGRLYRTALLYLGGEAAALDAVDEAVYRGLVSCGRLRQEEFFTTWITRILINVCNDELRRRRREIAVEELPETAAEAFDALPLRDAVARLPEKLRTAVHLYYAEGYSTEEIAALLGVPATTVRTRLHRARRQLKDLLGGMDDE